MKADSTVKRELRQLRKLINDAEADALTKRIAWEIEQAIRWAREDVKGWPSPLASAVSGANMIRDEIKRGDMRL